MQSVRHEVEFVALLWLALCLATPADARIKRSQSAKVEFKASHPCPATGARNGPCKGYVIDHLKALACGGADAPSNMQWQTIADSKAKDKWERKECGRQERRSSVRAPTRQSIELNAK